MDVVSPLRSRIRRLHRHSESEESPENSPSSRPLSATRGSPDRLLGYSDQQSDIIETRLDGQQEKSLSTLGVLSRDNIAMQGHFFRTIVGSSMDSSRKLSTRGGGFRSVILGEKAAETEVERFYQLSIAETERFRKAAEAEVSRFASENAQLRREIKEMVPQQHLAAAQMTIARLTMDARSLAAQLKEADARAAAAAKETELMRAQPASAVRAQRQQEAAAPHPELARPAHRGGAQAPHRHLQRVQRLKWFKMFCVLFAAAVQRLPTAGFAFVVSLVDSRASV